MPYASAAAHADSPHPYRQIRASYTPTTITVYQAYNASIASAAVAAGKFVPPFKRSRTTWIKPSFLWMMYRAGWGGKDENQERILAIDLKREGFEEALKMGQLSHYDPNAHGGSKEEWQEKYKKEKSEVVIQWDPERDIYGRPLGWRSIQIGLRDNAVAQYVDEWIVGIRDITEFCTEVKALVDMEKEEEAYKTMVREEVYELDEPLARAIGATVLA